MSWMGFNATVFGLQAAAGFAGVVYALFQRNVPLAAGFGLIALSGAYGLGVRIVALLHNRRVRAQRS